VPGTLYDTSAFSDIAVNIDALGFDIYAEALKNIIVKPTTRPPLVIGVYGPWGSGKSTFMNLVREKLEQHENKRQARLAPKPDRPWSRLWREIRVAWEGAAGAGRLSKKQDADDPSKATAADPKLLTIAYDAWAYADAPKLWAGLVADIAQELDRELGLKGRLHYAWTTLIKHPGRVFRAPLRRVFPLVLIVLSIIASAVLPFVSSNGPFADNPILGPIASIIAIGLGAFIAQHRPVSLSVESLTAQFSSAPVTGIIQDVKEELKTALQSRISLREAVAANKLKIVIFIDELDRCPLERIVSILEAIKLFLSEDVFIVLIAVDTRVAAEAINLQYKDAHNPDLPHEYIEKIVQIPLPVPTATQTSIQQYLAKVMDLPEPDHETNLIVPGESDSTPSLPPRRSLLNPEKSTPAQVHAKSLPQLPDTEEEAHHLAVLAAELLESNPRRIKRVLNTYRYAKILSSVYQQPVADPTWQRKMLAWLVFTIRWPFFMNDVIKQADTHVGNQIPQNGRSTPAAPPASSQQIASTEARQLAVVGTAAVAGAPHTTPAAPFSLQALAEGRKDAPTREDIATYLPNITQNEVQQFGKLASNFLIEHPQLYRATASSSVDALVAAGYLQLQ
jgi:hypothetical protein